MRLYRRRKDGRPTGPWIVWGFDAQGTRWSESTRCLDRKAAEATARELERRHASPDAARAQAATLADAVALLLADREGRAQAGTRSQATCRFYAQKTGHWRRVLGDAFRLAELSPAAVDRVLGERRKDGATEHTISKEIVALRCALKLARRAGLWTRDPAEVLPVGFSPGYTPRARHLTRTELQRLLAELPPVGAAMCAFMVATGARWSEAAGCLREHVEPGRVRLRGTKTQSSDRVVPLVHPEARGLVAHALAHAPPGEGGRLFATWKSPNHALRRAAARAGLEHLSFNDLRRTFAVWLREAGAPTDLIAPAMGHTTTQMVQRVYGRLSPEALADRLERAMGGAADMQQTGWTGVDSADSADSLEMQKPQVSPGFSVGHDRLELSANGLRVRCENTAKALWPRPKRARSTRSAADMQQPGKARRQR